MSAPMPDETSPRDSITLTVGAKTYHRDADGRWSQLFGGYTAFVFDHWTLAFLSALATAEFERDAAHSRAEELQRRFTAENERANDLAWRVRTSEHERDNAVSERNDLRAALASRPTPGGAD
jgi:hypothetical protein